HCLSLYTTPPPPTSTLFPYTTLFRSDQAPDHRALVGRQRFEQIADLGRGEGVDHPPHGTEPPAVQRIGQQAQLARGLVVADGFRSEEHTSELQSRENLVCRLLLEKKK